MKKREDKTPERARPAASATSPDQTGTVLKCEDIQELLLDYMTLELRGGRSVLVREHLRKCPSCQKAVQDMQGTFNVLQQLSREEGAIPEQLSDARRKRIKRSFMHPVLDWVYMHHFIVSTIIVIVCILLALIVMQHIPSIMQEPVIEEGVPVIIGPRPDSTNTPEVGPAPETEKAP